MDKQLNYMKKLYILYEIFKKGNFVASFREKYDKKLIYKWIYIFYPFVVFAINIYVIISNDVLYSSAPNFSYLKDLSNSLGLSILFFVSYFLSGYFPCRFDEWVIYGLTVHNFSYEKKDRYIFRIIYNVLPFLTIILGCIIGYCFFNVAATNDAAWWIRELSYKGRIVYCVFLGITWGRSISLLGMSIMGGLFIYLSIKTEIIKFVLSDYNMNISIIMVFDILVCTLSYGLFYIMGAILFILNDNVAAKNYKVFNTFSSDIASLILIIFVLFLVSLAYVPLQELYIYMKKQKSKILSQLDKAISNEKRLKQKKILIEKRNDIIVKNVLYTSFFNKLIIFLSVIIPLIGVILQTIELVS